MVGYPSAPEKDKTQGAYRSVVESEDLDQNLRPTAADTGLVGDYSRCRRMGVLTEDMVELRSRYYLDQSIAGLAVGNRESVLYTTCMKRGCYLVASKHDSSCEENRH